MSAGRLLRLMLALESGQRLTASDLARRLEVSSRTVLRDLDALSGAGVPVYAVRGCRGGFQLLGSVRETTAHPAAAVGPEPERRFRRARVRVSPGALRVAIATGRPQAWRARPRPDPPADGRYDWIEGTFRFDSYERAAVELLALGAEVEVLLPVELRATMADLGRRIAALHGA